MMALIRLGHDRGTLAAVPPAGPLLSAAVSRVFRNPEGTWKISGGSKDRNLLVSDGRPGVGSTL
jgi:hypothetical protein